MGAIVFLSTAWGPRHGGINAFNTDLSEAVASLAPGRLRVICVVLEASADEVDDAAARGVELVPFGSAADGVFDGARGGELAEASHSWGEVAWWIGHDVVSGPAAVAAAALTGSPSAVVQHTNYASYGAIKGTAGTKIIARGLAEVDTLLQANVVLGVGPNLTSAARDRVRERGKAARVRALVPGLADVEAIATPPETFRPIAFGRLDPVTDRLKQSRLAVHGFARLVKQTPRIVGNEPGMTVVGIPEDGAADQAELMCAAEDEAGRVVSVVGHPYTESRATLFRILRDASACLMLSLREGFGLTGWEAIAAGVPLVVSKHTGLYVFLAELGGPALGCVSAIDIRGSSQPPYYRNEDVDAVADALQAIAWDQDAAKRNAAELKKIVAEYTWERTARDLLDALEMPLTAAPTVTVLSAAATLPPSNLRAPTEPLVGRTEQLEEYREIVRGGCRLLTLLGTAGVGKTRVALDLARTLLGDFHDHVYFVDLTAVSDPSLVITSITQALRIDAKEPLLDALKELFRDEPALVVLDNFEQVRDAGLTVRALLDAAPGLHVIATSREPMGLAMERQAIVPPLAPDDAARLYADRVAAHGAGDVPDAGTLAALCNTLDRLPLGIELAASLAGVVPAAELVPMLEKSALDLKTRRQDVDDRQRSLRAAIDWSYELLTESERRLFRRLAVFEGGWTLQMAAAVVDGGGAVDLAFADAMGSLLDKHLIRKASGERFEMLGTLHQYAAEQLGKDAGEAEEMRRRHAAYFVKVGEVARAGGGAASVATRLQQLEVEQDNLTTALTALVDRGELSGALRLGVTLGRFWWARNYAEGYRRLDVLRQLPAAPPLRSLRAEMLLERGRLAIRLARLEDAAAAFAEALALAEAEGDARLEARALADAALVPMERADFAAARPRLERALELRRAGRDPGEIADSLDSLGVVATGTGDYGAATAFLEESLIHYRMAGDAQGEAWVLNDMARVALATDDPGTAHDRAAAALAIGRDLSDWGLTAWARNYLGLVASRRGAHDEAREHHVESLRLVRLLGDARPIALAIEGFAALAAEQERWERAVQLASAAESVRVAFEIRRTVADEAILDLRLRGAKAALTGAELERATAAGRAMSLDQAAALAGE